MPLQYIVVSLMGLFCLSVQHWQFLGNRSQGMLASSISRGWSVLILMAALCGCTCLLCRSILIEFNFEYIFILMGYISQVGWLSYAIPQMIENMRNPSSASAVSLTFVCLALLASACDCSSAWNLNWDWPSKIGAPASFLIKLIFLGHLIYCRINSNRHNEALMNTVQS